MILTLCVVLLLIGLGWTVRSSSEVCHADDELVSCEDIPTVEKFKEALLLAYLAVVLEYQMYQYYDKDINRIV